MPTINTTEIIDQIKVAAKVAGGGRTPHLRAVWLHFSGNSLVIRATDSQTDYAARIPLPNPVQEEQIIGLDGRMLSGLLAKLQDGPVEMTREESGEENVCRIRQGRRKFDLATMEPYWYSPGDPFPTADKSFFLSGSDMSGVIHSVEYCVSTDDTQGSLACLLLDQDDTQLVAVGLSGHQMAIRRFPAEGMASSLPDGGLKIQRRFLSDLRSFLAEKDIEAATTKGRLHLRDAGRTEHWSIPLHLNEFPDWRKLAKTEGDGSQSIIVHRQPLIESLERLKFFVTQESIVVWLNMQDQHMDLSVKSGGRGQGDDYVPIVRTGDLSRIGFPLEDLLRILGYFRGEEVRFVFNADQGPCFIRDQAGNTEYSVLLMPMMVNDDVEATNPDSPGSQE